MSRFNRWSDEEEQDVVKELSRGMSLAAIGTKHKRSANAIKLRVTKIFNDMMAQGKSVSDIATAANLKEDDVRAYLKVDLEEEKQKRFGKQEKEQGAAADEKEGEGKQPKRWTDAEEAQLLLAVASGQSWPTIAEKHGRTEKAVTARLSKMLKAMHTKGKTLQQISTEYRIPQAQVEASVLGNGTVLPSDAEIRMLQVKAMNEIKSLLEQVFIKQSQLAELLARAPPAK